ncbi:DnaA regulatory inactivator Hda [Pseudomonadota bacterium]|nr:DnaA regulatory inactivator Hda [Pseudomonadota bacterium]
MNVSSTQLPLRLNPQQVFRFDNFHFNQAEVKLTLADLCESDKLSFVYLWAEKSAGKSHLLLAATEQPNLRALYLPLADLVQSAAPEMLQSLEHLDLLCMDDLDAISGHADWQEAVFHCFNRMQVAGCKLLVSAQKNPANIELTLADLRSRMGTALVYQLDSLSDDDKRQALILQAQSRGLELSDDVANYLLRHHSRDMSLLMDLLLELDKASLAAQRRLTIPFVRPFLNV